VAWGVNDLVVDYGDHRVVSGVSVTASSGAVTALVGGDGAGKTSVLRALVGLVRPAAGSVASPPKRQIGYVSAGPGLYRDLTVEENLLFSGRAYGMSEESLARRAGFLLDRTELSAARQRLAGQLSGGMRQKLALAMALLHEPQLLVLDEATTGVDPVSRAELWRLIARAAAEGAAVVIATSYVDEAERAENVVVLSGGDVLVSGPPDQIVASIPGALFETRDRPRGLRSWRRGESWRAWSPELGAVPGAHPSGADLEDAVIVAELRRLAGAPEEQLVVPA
jgi:ABC-2 type transport system ATP-binding protein